MRSPFPSVLALAVYLAACGPAASPTPPTPTHAQETIAAAPTLPVVAPTTAASGTARARTPTVAGPGEELLTFVQSEGIGRIAVRVETPRTPRFPEGAPVVVEVSGWFTLYEGIRRVNDVTKIGAISVSFLWPGKSDPKYGVASEGEEDFAGPNAMAALRDVIRFASGTLPDSDGFTLDQLVSVSPLYDNVGLFASSHSGVAATNVLAYHGAEIPGVRYLVGRENPTREEFYPLELGFFDEQGNVVPNGFFDEDAYSPTEVTVDYSTAAWCSEAAPPRPCFEAADGTPAFVVSADIWPTMWGKRYYSRGLTQALLDNGALTPDTWPDDLATVEETQQAWPYRVAVDNYPRLATTRPDLKVMLVFALVDHVQPAASKVHIHQAWDGFHGSAELSWVRLNPDLAYVRSVDPNLGAGFPDNDANTEPDDWRTVEEWAFPVRGGRENEQVWQAAVAEMIDRVHEDNWSNNLDEVLIDYRLPEQQSEAWGSGATPGAGQGQGVAVFPPPLKVGELEGECAAGGELLHEWGFASGLEGWEARIGSLRHTVKTFAGEPGAALLVTSETSPDGGNLAVAGDCLDLDPAAATHALRLEAYLLAMPEIESVSLSVFFHSQVSCRGEVLDVAGPPAAMPASGWTFVSASSPVPPGAASADFVVRAASQSASGRALVDRVCACYQPVLLGEIPRGPHDVPVGSLVTETLGVVSSVDSP